MSKNSLTQADKISALRIVLEIQYLKEDITRSSLQRVYTQLLSLFACTRSQEISNFASEIDKSISALNLRRMGTPHLRDVLIRALYKGSTNEQRRALPLEYLDSEEKADLVTEQTAIYLLDVLGIKVVN